MTPRKLQRAQKRIDDMVTALAVAHGLCNDNYNPIRDGIASEQGYLQSRLRVAWVLKEPYDEWGEDGKPCGGGWSLVKDCFQKDDAWQNQAWRIMAYVMYGFRYHLSWKQMHRKHLPWRPIIDELKNIAWINLSKMPSHTSSNMSLVFRNYTEHWKAIVAEQLRVYQPEVIIFGKTFGCMRDSFPDAVKDGRRSNETLSFFRRRGQNQILLATGHPGRKGEEYVDALRKALQKICQMLGK